MLQLVTWFTMAVQTRNKQPRPLSIICEGSLDDDLGSDAQITTSSNQTEITPRTGNSETTTPTRNPEITTSTENSENTTFTEHLMIKVCNDHADSKTPVASNYQKSVRRLGVAPLRHPGIEFIFKYSSADSRDVVHYENSKHDKEIPETIYSHNRSGNSGNKSESLDKVGPDIENSSSGNGCKNGLVTTTFLSRAVHHEASKSKKETSIQEMSRSLNISENFATRILNETELRNSSGNNTNKVSIAKDDFEGQNKENVKNKEVLNDLCDLKGEKAKNVLLNKSNIVKNERIVDDQTDDTEQFDQEQQAWKKRVRKSSSFTRTSIQRRPLRRSAGSYDNKNSTSLMDFRLMNSKKAEGTQIIANLSPSLSRIPSWHEQCREMNNIKLKTNASDENKYLMVRNTQQLASTPNIDQLGSSTLLHSTKSQSCQSPSNLQPINCSTQFAIQSNFQSAIDQSDFNLLKATTTRLNLSTRRASTTAWKANLLDNEAFKKQNTEESLFDEKNAGKSSKICSFTREDIRKINEQLSSLRQDLIGIRQVDQVLARQFLDIRHLMNEFRLNFQCEGHMMLLDNAKEEMEDIRELSHLVDIPSELLSPLASLQHVGVTKMNINSRRFSTC